MRLCTTCGRRWEIVGPCCPDDGTPLVDAEAAAPDRSPSATWSAGQAALAEPRPAPRDVLAPGDRVGEYVIERRIGAGGMGVVYGARHPVIGKRAAIKILAARLTADEEALSRFVLEAQAVNRIGHANIVDIFSFGTLDDGRSYLAMEWLAGETLGQRLERGRLGVREAAAILSPLCRALEAAHAAGVIHRDLKPDNVFLVTDDEGGRVKLLDFGIAKLSTATVPGSRTATGVAMGTPLYMAPEQARGDAVDGRTDVYALGLLAYTMVCGASLFEDEGSAVEILAAHIGKPPVPPCARVPDLPAALDALILEMIAKDAAARPALIDIRRRLATIAAAAAAAPVVAGAPTLPAEIAALPPARPGAGEPLHERPATAPAVGELLPGGAAVALPDGTRGPATASASRRPRWPLGLVALAAVAAATAVIAVRGRARAPAAGVERPGASGEVPGPAASPAPPTSAPPAPPSSPPPPAAAPSSGSAPSSAPAPAPAPGSASAAPVAITAELAVEPRDAPLSVDGLPVALVGGRARLALTPGDHEAVASAGGRVARQRFRVTRDRAARVALRVAAAAPPPTAPHVDVDGVEDPFHR